jgi:hypothetical protein
MTERHYTCTLLTDVVINASLATEGNMTSLDYIPGSSILGIVANDIYNLKDYQLAYEILHSDWVSFGDARVAIDKYPSLPVPFQFFTDKVNKDLTKDPVYLAHFITEKKDIKDDNGRKIQPQQVRSGYFHAIGSSAKLVTSLPKKFSLKSANNRDTRTAQDSQMFGIEAMQAGLEFIFSIRSKNEEHLDQIEQFLIGVKRLGKSKSAEYGQVDIEKCEGLYSRKTESLIPNAVLVYAESNLCFYDELCMPTYTPTAKQLGLSGGKISWEKSQIRTFDYSNWNTKRQTNNPTKYCIARGSVFFVEQCSAEMDFGSVGEWQAEGLGRVLYNPSFLNGDANSAKSYLKFKKVEPFENGEKEKPKEGFEKTNSILMNWLSAKEQENKTQLALSREVHLQSKAAESSKIFGGVSSSQWGKIREYATYAKSPIDFAVTLLNNPKKKQLETDGQWKARKGYLTHGVAYDSVWGRRNDTPIKELMKIFGISETSKTEEGCHFECNNSLDFIAKFSGEMAKLTIRKKHHEKS